MANDRTSNPWILDTVESAPPAGFFDNVEVRHFEFSGYSSGSDRGTIKSGEGRVVWDVTGDTDLEEIRSGAVGWIHDGLYASSVGTGGVIRVYLR